MTNAEYRQQIDYIALVMHAAIRLREACGLMEDCVERGPFDRIAADIDLLAERMRVRLRRQLPELTTSNPAYYEREHELLIAATREEEPV